MPTVPQYGGPQVAEQALNARYQSADQYTTGARTLAEAGQALNKTADVLDRVVVRDAEAKANDVDTQLTRAWNDWEDANRGKFVNQGADGYKAAVEGWWKDAAKNYGESLDPLARSMVGKTLSRRQTIALDQAGKYEFAEKEKYADSTAESAMRTATVNAMRSGDYAGEAQRVRDLVSGIAVRKNLDKDQRDAQMNVRMATFHSAVIAQIAEKDAGAAQTYLDEAIKRGEISPDQQTRIESIVKGEADNQFAAQEAARMAAMPLKDQLSEAAKITDPQRREKTLTQVRNNYALVKQAQQEQEAGFADQAWQAFAKGQRIPEAILSGMNGRERVQLQEAQRTRSERVAAGTPVKTDMATYIDLREKLAKGEKVDLRAFTEKIAPAQIEQLLDIQNSASKPGPMQDSMLTDEQRITAALPGAGIDKKKDPDGAGLFMSEVDRRVRALSASKGDKPVTPDEKQKIVDAVSMDKVFIDEWGTDPEKPIVLVKPEDLKKAYVVVNGKNVPVSTVPPSDRMQIIQARRARGLSVNEQAIVETYMGARLKRSGTVDGR
jgi:hypothetical protein